MFTLTAGVTYELSFTPSFITFSNSTGGFLCYEWVDATTNTPLDSTGIGIGTIVPTTDTSVQNDNPTARVIYTPSTNQTVKIYTTSGNGTATLRGAIGTQAIIKPLNSTIVVQSININSLGVSGNGISSYSSNASSDALYLSSNNAHGGTDYAGLITLKNTSASATANTKYIRMSSDGQLQIINAGYSQNILNIDDVGNASFSNNVTVSGNIIMANRPAFRVYGATNTGWTTSSPTGGVLTGSQYTVDYQQGGTPLNTTTGIFTAPIAGLYQIYLIARTNSNNSGAGSAIAVQKNGTNVVYLEWAASTTTNHIGGGSIVKLNIGDTLKLVVSSGTINFDVNDNWSVAFIG